MYCRVNYYIQNGWADQMIINPDPVFINPAKDDTMTTAGTITTVQNIFERQPQDPQAWQDIKVAYQSHFNILPSLRVLWLWLYNYYISFWCNKYILELESYFDGYMLPEIVCPKFKPSYIL